MFAIIRDGRDFGPSNETLIGICSTKFEATLVADWHNSFYSEGGMEWLHVMIDEKNTLLSANSDDVSIPPETVVKSLCDEFDIFDYIPLYFSYLSKNSPSHLKSKFIVSYFVDEVKDLKQYAFNIESRSTRLHN